MRRRKQVEEEPSPSKAKRAPTLSSFDLFPKVHTEELEKTPTGGTMSLLALLVVGLLLLSELRTWLTVTRTEHMTVDAVVEGRVRINFDIT